MISVLLRTVLCHSFATIVTLILQRKRKQMFKYCQIMLLCNCRFGYVDCKISVGVLYQPNLYQKCIGCLLFSPENQ